MRDSGLMHALLQIETRDELLGHPKLGDSWEGFVIESILAAAPDEAESRFYRSSAGAEIDLILTFRDQRWAVEIKHTSAPKVSKGFYIACEDINPTEKFVIHAGSESFPIGEGIQTLPLQMFMQKLREYA